MNLSSRESQSVESEGGGILSPPRVPRLIGMGRRLVLARLTFDSSFMRRFVAIPEAMMMNDGLSLANSAAQCCERWVV